MKRYIDRENCRPSDPTAASLLEEIRRPTCQSLVGIRLPDRWFPTTLPGFDARLKFVMGAHPDQRWKMKNRNYENWKQIRAGNIILIRQASCGWHEYVAEWVRIYRDDPNYSDGQMKADLLKVAGRLPGGVAI